MPKKADEIVSAQVILRPASGKALHSPVTSDTVQQVLPSSSASAAARKAFTDMGFNVGPLVANSFSVTAPIDKFNTLFKTRLQRDAESREIKVVHAHGQSGYELPLETLPRSVASHIEAVTLTPPPDFGPSSY